MTENNPPKKPSSEENQESPTLSDVIAESTQQAVDGVEEAGEEDSTEKPQLSETEQQAEKIKDLEDRLLRTHAELENLRKRSQREMADVYKYASIELMRDLLPAMDNMERALEATETATDVESLKQGVEMVRQQFQAALSQHGCKPIEALEQPFDPNLHEALFRQPNADYPPMTVLQEFRTGFQLHDRVVRPSQVSVSTTPEAASEASATSPETETQDEAEE